MQYATHVVNTGVAALVSLLSALIIWNFVPLEKSDFLIMVAARMGVIELVCLGCGRTPENWRDNNKVRGHWILDFIFVIGIAWLFVTLIAEINAFAIETKGQQDSKDAALAASWSYVVVLLLQGMGLPRGPSVFIGFLYVTYAIIVEKKLI